MDKGTLIRKKEEQTLLGNLNKNICYAVVCILILTTLTGCKSREAQFLIDGFQEAKAEVEAEEKETADVDRAEENVSKEPEISEEPEKAAEIYVDVCGAVANPGVFRMEEGSRVFQAIEVAGGFLPEAAQTCVNQAGILADGQQLYILTQEEMEQQDLKPGETVTAQNNTSGTDLNRQDSRVNINTADESQLTTLTGIGATRAKAIIAYREENGPFAAIEDIMNVQGIKEGTFAKIKDEIVVG